MTLETSALRRMVIDRQRVIDQAIAQLSTLEIGELAHAATTAAIFAEKKYPETSLINTIAAVYLADIVATRRENEGV